ncbi:MAG: peptide chain release factor N(5)-glutamine methyltransferase [Oscillospiraceae bacterium]
MKYVEVYRFGLMRLKENNIDNADFDNRILFENCFGMGRNQFAINGENQADDDLIKKFLKDIELRIEGQPLQYIIGNWEFMGLSFNVGKGVLIPREETEILVNTALDYLKNRSNKKVVFDLCSGSGCVGISVAYFCKNCDVYLIEKSLEALQYLKKNVEMFGLENIFVINGDITNGFESFNLPNPDIILSNPPYIKSDEIKTLQIEVRLEPEIALDGGEDGLYFYRILEQKWAPSLNKHGMMAVEIGDNQDKEVCKIFEQKFKTIRQKQDFSKIIRVIQALR